MLATGSWSLVTSSLDIVGAGFIPALKSHSAGGGKPRPYIG
jgi:hypothetical protein